MGSKGAIMDLMRKGASKKLLNATGGRGTLMVVESVDISFEIES